MSARKTVRCWHPLLVLNLHGLRLGTKSSKSAATAGISEAPRRYRDHGGRFDPPWRSGRTGPAQKSGSFDRGWLEILNNSNRLMDKSLKFNGGGFLTRP